MAARQDVTLVIRARDLTRGVFRRLRRSLTGFRASVAGLFGAFTFGALAREAVNTATEIEGAARRLGASGDDLEALRTIAGDLNIEFSTLAGVIQRLGTNAARAAGNNETLFRAFQDLDIGATPDELRRLSDLEVFFRVADAAAVRNWNDIRDSIVQIGDTEAGQLRGLFEQGSPALQRQIDELIASGEVLGQANREAAAAAEAQFRRDAIEAQRALADAIIALTPIIQQAVPVIREAVEIANRLISAGQESGGFGLGEAAFEVTRGETPARRLARTAAGPIGVGLEASAEIVSILKGIRDNTQDSGTLR